MNLKFKYFLLIVILSLVKSIKKKEICPVYNFLINDNSFSNNSLVLPENKISSNYYLNTITDLDLISQCEEHCEKCLELKTNADTKCIKCNEGFFLYKFRCVEQCPNDTYFYTYKTKIITSGSIVSIKACDENCEEGYTGIIFKGNNEDMINKLCVLNYYENILDYIEEKLDKFKKLDYGQKINEIQNQYSLINSINDINTNDNFHLINKEFILFNEYINFHKTIAQKDNNIINIIEVLNLISEHYFTLIENYFTSIQGELNILSNINSDNNFIYFISSLSSLFNNKDMLNENYYNKLYSYTLTFSPALINIPLTLAEIDKINIIANYYGKFINITIDKEINYIDPNFNSEEFDSNEFYRYTHEILLNDGNKKLLGMINDFIKFLLNINSDIFLYKNEYIYFYKQKLSKEKNDKQIIMPKIGLELYLLGTESNKTLDSFSISNILESTDEGKIDNYKIILPPLNKINNQINWNQSFFNLIIFNGKYPLLNGNNTKYVSPNFFEINLYDNNKNIININNLDKDNLIKIIKKKSETEQLLRTCVSYDSSKENLNDEGIKSYDLLQYILCSTSHLSTFTITSFSPSYLLSKSENNQEISEEEMIRNSRWIPDTNMLNKLTAKNAVILYINVGFFFICIILLLIKFLITKEQSKSEQLIEDSFIRYTINEDIESDKKILKYLIEKEIEFILKNQSDYEKQKKQELVLNSKNDIFNSDEQVITIIEDGSNDDDEEDIFLDRSSKKVSFRKLNTQKKEKNNSLSNLKGKKSLRRSQTSKNDINMEMSIIKDDFKNDLIEFDENREDSMHSKKYNFFNFKNYKRKSLGAPSVASLNRKSTYGNFENLLKERKNKNKNVKRQSLNDRFMKSVKEQKSRLIYSLMNKIINEFKSNGQNTLDIPTSMIKRPLSMIEISNALNKINNKDDEKILINQLNIYIIFF